MENENNNFNNNQVQNNFGNNPQVQDSFNNNQVQNNFGNNPQVQDSFNSNQQFQNNFNSNPQVQNAFNSNQQTTINNELNNVPTFTYQQNTQSTVNTESSIENLNNKSNKTNKTKMIIIFLVLALAIGFVLIKFVINTPNKSSNSNISTETSEVIIIRNNIGNAAIFNTDGKQLSDFIYTSVYEFKNGAALVQKDYSKKAIIDTKGKYIADFDEFKYIISHGYLYEVTDSNHNHYLINSKGKNVYNIDDGMKVQKYFSEEIAIVETENFYDILDANGKSIKKINKVKDMELDVYDSEENVLTIYYNNTTYVINVLSGKVLNTISSSDAYCVNSANSLNNNEYVLHPCDDYDSLDFASYTGNKLNFKTSTCSNLFYEHNNPNLICSDKDSLSRRYIMSNKGEKQIEIYHSSISYINGTTYVTSDNNSTVFYVNGKEVKKIDCTSPIKSGFNSSKVFILKGTCDSQKGKYQYYNQDGERIINTYFKDVSQFDQNNLASVSEDGKSYYLINKSGKKISNEYEKIDFNFMTLDNPVYVTHKNDTVYILDTNGKEVINSTGDVDIYENYLTIYNDGVTTYYTFKGKEFYKKY